MSERARGRSTRGIAPTVAAIALIAGVPTHRDLSSRSGVNPPVVASRVPNRPVHSATHPAARHSSRRSRNAAVLAVKNCAPWSHCHPRFSGSRVCRVAVRPPGPRPVSYTVTRHPARASRLAQVSPEINETTFVRSLYFQDPDGFQLEFAAWARELGPGDVNAEPVGADG